MADSDGNCVILNLFAQNLNVSKLEPREALSFERNKIVIKQTLKLFESSTCLENGKLLPSGIIDFATGLCSWWILVTFFSLTVGHKKILVVLVSVLYHGEFQLACQETWWMKITVLSTSYLLYDPNLFTTKGRPVFQCKRKVSITVCASCPVFKTNEKIYGKKFVIQISQIYWERGLQWFHWALEIGEFSVHYV